MVYKIKKIIFILFFSVGFSQEIIGEGLQGQELIQYLINNYKTSNVLSYNGARDAMYGYIDNENGSVQCIYTEYTVDNVPSDNPRAYLYENGIDCEHLFPQSMYEGTSPMKSDIHHLRPCKSNVNSSRGNKPYNESNDNQTQTWYWLEYQQSNPPNQNRDKYSESASGVFEPREEVKGDIARAIFYFYTMYSNVADDNFFEEQKDILYDWHQDDPINQLEVNRTWDIADYQDYPNPFIVDETLIQRCYYEQDIDFVIGDVNLDNIINVLDIIVIMNYILNLSDLNDQQIELADMNQDQGINILDIVLLIGEIIS
ncbi:hypothetical protein DBW61_01205 [bacterium]|nr:MAG: hypothetical protein CBB66_02615 [bacterium TMED6]RCL87220.1 MAG: hypothetical protein DBW61_01205 [bacterium]|tara:strand:+ start:11393 stop:12334 length:942 start_codon:yes stop_codon:yes gene_type:complete